MAFTFVVEDGSADSDANSYCTVEFADDYIEAHTHQSEAWFDLEEEVKQRLLVRASKVIDYRFKWEGTRVEQDSGLKWPRAGVYDEDGFLIRDDQIPRILQEAVAEFAVYIMNDDWTAPRENDEFSAIQVDVISLKFNTDFRRAYMPESIEQMLSSLGRATSGRRPSFRPIIRN